MSAGTYGKVRFGANGAAPLSTGPPAAMYPAAVADNNRLTVAVDRLQAKLAAPLGIPDTTMTVQDGSGIVASCLLSIDSEIVQVISGSGTTYQISRAFDGTAAAMHLTGATVSGFIDAWHHNALVSEVRAIENFLGPNGNHLPAFALIVSSAYAFAPQAPGGSLTVGTNPVTLTPVPAGVNGSDTAHYLYVSGGTGTAEACLIVGGTGRAGDASGQIFIQCAVAHSGAWTIRTATAGVQEAVIASIASGWCDVIVPAGNWNVYAPTTIPFGMRLHGVGIGISQLFQQTANAGIISAPNIAGFGALVISDLSLCYGVTATAGAALALAGKNFPVTIHDVFIYEPFDGISMSSVAIEMRNIVIMRAKRYGISGGGGLAGNWSDIWISSPGAGGTTGNGEAGVYLTPNLDGIQLTNFVATGFKKGIWVDGTGAVAPAYLSNLFIANAYIEESVETGIKVFLNSLAGGVYQFTNVRIASVVAPSGAAIEFSYGGPTGSIAIANSFTYGHATGIFLNGTNNVAITGCNIHTTAVTNSVGIWLDNTLAKPNAHVTITGNNIGFDPESGGTTGAVPNYAIFIGAGPVSIASIVGNNLNSSNPAAVINGPDRLNAGSLITSNPGYNPVGPSAITVGASPYTYTAGPSPEIVYISGGTVSAIKRGAATIATASPAQVSLPPFGTLQVTYSAVPVMVKDVF